MPLNMGRGTDTRMYNPHSESSYMFRDNDEDQEKYGRGDSEFHEEKDNEKKTRRQLQNERLDKIRPFSLTDLDMSMAQEEETSDTGEEPDEPEFDARPSGNINDDTAGSRGHMLDVAVGARTGTGSAMGGIPTGPPGPVGNFGMIRRSDAEEAAWSELLKMTEEEQQFYYTPEKIKRRTQRSRNRSPFRRDRLPVALDDAIDVHHAQVQDRYEELKFPEHLRQAHHSYPPLKEARLRVPSESLHLLPYEAGERNKIADLGPLARDLDMNPREIYNIQDAFPHLIPTEFREDEPPSPSDKEDVIEEMGGMMFVNGQMMSPEEFAQYQAQKGDIKGDPLEMAWSELLKSKKSKHDEVQRGGIGTSGTRQERRKEHRKKWAQKKFKTGGGRRQDLQTIRRHKRRQRMLTPRHKAGTGQKGGLLEAGLAAHMAHLGVKSKQPKRYEDVRGYSQQMGQQAGRRRRGDIALPYSEHAMTGEVTQNPGPTGSGRLQRLPGESRGMPHVRRPRLRRVTGFTPHTASTAPTAPRLPAAASMGLPSASSIAMSEPSEIEQIRSDILKARRITDEAHFAWMRNMLREIKEKIDKVKKTATKDTSGGGDDKPQHASNRTRRQTSRPEGATETDPGEDPRLWGAHPGDLVGQH